MQEQVDDRDLAGLARPRAPVARPVASADPTVLGPAPAPLDCPYLHLDDDGPSCLALPPAIRLARRQVEIVCAVAAHMACPRLVKAEAGRVPVVVDPPAPVGRGRERMPDAAAPVVGGAPATAVPAPTESPTEPSADGAPADGGPADGRPAGLTAGSVDPPAPVLDPIAGAPPRGDPSTTTPAASTVIAPGGAATGPANDRASRPAAEPSTPVVAARVAAALALVRATARRHIVLRPATAAAWLIFLAAVLVVIAVLTARGGLTLPAIATPSPGVAGASPSLAGSSATASATPGASPTLSASPSASPSASSSPVPTASPTPPPSPSPSVSTPFSPDQLALLKPCPGKPACYQYRIKSGDNLHNIATFFGLTYPALLAANPQITNPSVIHVGQLIIVPFPTPAKATPSPKP